MSSTSVAAPPAPTLQLPFETPPPNGTPIEIAPGLLWLRLALPFRLDHVNVYALRDGPGYAILDTGIFDEATIAVWTALLDGFLAQAPITRIIVSHFHPDHAGMAG